MTRKRYQDSDEWRQERRTGYGASDAPILVEGNEAAWRQLHGEKLGLLPDREASETMDLGKRFEDAIAAVAAERMGERLVRVDRLLRHREHPFVFASLDRRVRGGNRRPVEIKKWGYKSDEWGPAGSDIVPPRILYQVQQQAAVVGSDAVEVAVLFGGAKLEVFTVGRDEGIIDELIGLEVAAWAYVVRGEMPPWPGQAPKRIVLAHDEVEVDEMLADLINVDALRQAFAHEAKEHADSARDRIREYLADAGGAKGVLPDGRRVSVSHRPSEPVTKTDWKLVAQAYRKWIDSHFLVNHDTGEFEGQLDTDAIESLFTVTEEPRRPLRITIGKNGKDTP